MSSTGPPATRQQRTRLTSTVRSLAVAVGALVVSGAVTSLFIVLAASTRARIEGPAPDSPADLLILGMVSAGALLTVWLGLGFVVAALASLPGAFGAAFDVVACRLAPAAVRRAVALLLGTALTLAVVPSAALAAGDPVPGARPAAVLSVTAPDPGFRSTTPEPAAAASGAASPGIEAPAAPAPGTPAVVSSLGPLGQHPQAGTNVGGHVVVRRGDTLWDIAARHLGPGATTARIAHEWPRWHAANRALIGPDPDRIQPGQRLVPPAAKDR